MGKYINREALMGWVEIAGNYGPILYNSMFWGVFTKYQCMMLDCHIILLVSSSLTNSNQHDQHKSMGPHSPMMTHICIKYNNVYNVGIQITVVESEYMIRHHQDGHTLAMECHTLPREGHPPGGEARHPLLAAATHTPSMEGVPPCTVCRDQFP